MVAAKVRGVVMTSSPGSRFSDFKTMKSPAVAEETATIYGAPVYSLSIRSNCFTRGPVVIQPEFRHSAISAYSFLPILGFENGRKSSRGTMCSAVRSFIARLGLICACCLSQACSVVSQKLRGSRNRFLRTNLRDRFGSAPHSGCLLSSIDRETRAC